MIDDIGSPEFQSFLTGWGFLCSTTIPLRDFAVLYYTRFIVLEDDETDGFVWGSFADDFGCDGEFCGEGIADEGGVSDADETIVYAVGVDMFNGTRLEVGED
jgi:hypothetical protein